jgi:carbonic anhydrase/acetyltransferase-like protein (isoleucine patch superfamily)
MAQSAAPPTHWNRQVASPHVHPAAFVDSTAILIGDVRLAEGVAVLPRVVLRADEGSPIVIGKDSNVQDGVIMHALLGTSVSIGEACTVAHGAIVHGPCELESGCFVGFASVVLNVKAGPGCFISHRALVQDVTLPEATLVPPGAVVTSQEQVADLPQVCDRLRSFARGVLEVNDALRRGYMEAFLGDRQRRVDLEGE